MCYVKVSQIEDGLIPSEKVVSIATVDGREEVAVSGSLLRNNAALRAAFVGADNERGRVLIELPCESTTGRRRVWVASGEIVSI